MVRWRTGEKSATNRLSPTELENVHEVENSESDHGTHRKRHHNEHRRDEADEFEIRIRCHVCLEPKKLL